MTSAREWPRTTTFRCAATATSYNYNKIFRNRRNLGTYPDIHSSRVEFVYLIKAIQHYRKQDTGPKQFEFKFTNIRWRDSSHGYVRSPYMNQFPVADYVSFLLFSHVSILLADNGHEWLGYPMIISLRVGILNWWTDVSWTDDFRGRIRYGFSWGLVMLVC